MFSTPASATFTSIMSLYEQLDRSLKTYLLSDRQRSLGFTQDLATVSNSAYEQISTGLNGCDFGNLRGLQNCAHQLQSHVKSTADVLKRISASARPNFNDLRDLKHLIAELRVVGAQGLNMQSLEQTQGPRTFEIVRSNADVIVNLSGRHVTELNSNSPNLDEMDRRAAIILSQARGLYVDKITPIALGAQKLIGTLSLYDTSEDWMTEQARESIQNDFSAFTQVIASI